MDRAAPVAQGVLPVGVLIGAVSVAMAFYNKDLFPEGAGVHIGPLFAPAYILMAYPLMIALGGLSSFFVVPMNAILQHRSTTLLSAGHSNHGAELQSESRRASDARCLRAAAHGPRYRYNGSSSCSACSSA